MKAKPLNHTIPKKNMDSEDLFYEFSVVRSQIRAAKKQMRRCRAKIYADSEDFTARGARINWWERYFNAQRAKKLLEADIAEISKLRLRRLRKDYPDADVL